MCSRARTQTQYSFKLQPVGSSWVAVDQGLSVGKQLFLFTLVSQDGPEATCFSLSEGRCQHADSRPNPDQPNHNLGGGALESALFKCSPGGGEVMLLGMIEWLSTGRWAGPLPRRRRLWKGTGCPPHTPLWARGMLPYLFETGSQKQPGLVSEASPAAGETMTANREGEGDSLERWWPPGSQQPDPAAERGQGSGPEAAWSPGTRMGLQVLS